MHQRVVVVTLVLVLVVLIHLLIAAVLEPMLVIRPAVATTTTALDPAATAAVALERLSLSFQAPSEGAHRSDKGAHDEEHADNEPCRHIGAA